MRLVRSVWSFRNSRSCWWKTMRLHCVPSSSSDDITQMLKFIECRKLVAFVVVNVALCLLVILPNDRHASEKCCEAFDRRVPGGRFLDSEFWWIPKVNLASRLHEVLVVQKLHERQRVCGESCCQRDRSLQHVSRDQVCHNDIPCQLEGQSL